VKVKQSVLLAEFFLALVASSAFGQLFESDSKRLGTSKMDIVVREIERRPRTSVLDIKINSVGSSVGASFFLLCSIRQLARLRGDFQYIVKLEEKPKRGQMLVGFLTNADEPLINVGKEFEHLNPAEAIINLEQFASICDSMK
jgi:hypothetical protein